MSKHIHKEKRYMSSGPYLKYIRILGLMFRLGVIDEETHWYILDRMEMYTVG